MYAWGTKLLVRESKRTDIEWVEIECKKQKLEGAKGVRDVSETGRVMLCQEELRKIS